MTKKRYVDITKKTVDEYYTTYLTEEVELHVTEGLGGETWGFVNLTPLAPLSLGDELHFSNSVIRDDNIERVKNFSRSLKR